MVADDDRTLVGEQPWIDRQIVLPPGVFPEATPLVDPQTARAVRALCWAVCVAIWCGIAILMIVLAGLIVGVFSSPAPP